MSLCVWISAVEGLAGLRERHSGNGPFQTSLASPPIARLITLLNCDQTLRTALGSIVVIRLVDDLDGGLTVPGARVQLYAFHLTEYSYATAQRWAENY